MKQYFGVKYFALQKQVLWSKGIQYMQLFLNDSEYTHTHTHIHIERERMIKHLLLAELMPETAYLPVSYT